MPSERNVYRSLMHIVLHTFNSIELAKTGLHSIRENTGQLWDSYLHLILLWCI